MRNAARPKPATLQIILSFSLLALASLAAVVSGAVTEVAGTVTSTILPLGLPGLPFHLRLDPLAGFFLVVIGLMGLCDSIYSIGYTGYGKQHSITRMVVFYAYFFLVAWELMAASSYFLVLQKCRIDTSNQILFES